MAKLTYKPGKSNANQDGGGTFHITGPGEELPSSHETIVECVLPKIQGFWKVLLVDDEADVIQVTKMLMRDLAFDGRPVQFLEAYSAAEARQLLMKNPDIAVSMIDVVMETDDAGLMLVDFIRKTTRNSYMRIIIRTGQPGQAPERYVVDHYDIDDYKEKTDLTTEKLYTALRSCLKAYRDIIYRYQVEEERRLASIVTDNAAEAIVVTNCNNEIISVNPAFTKITGYSLEEAMGQNPRLLKSDRQEASFYQDMWRGINTLGIWHGQIWNRRKNGEIYPQWLSISTIKNQSGEILQHVGLFSDISENVAAQQRIDYLVHYDDLTALPNRVLLHDRLLQAINLAHRKSASMALLYLNIDRFKVINDSLGHGMGDQLLKMIAERIAGCVRDTDTLARIGGDEFVVVLFEAGAEGAAAVSRKIIEEVSKPYDVKGHILNTSPSIGIAVHPTDGKDGETLMKNADAAMYYAKNSGRANFQFFTQAMNDSAHDRFALENGLRQALTNHEFVVYYQPQVEISSGQVVGCEALLRWNHPEKGMIPPDQFIPIAEETGLIIPIGQWVLETACAQAKAWKNQGFAALTMAVNLSGVQFTQQDLQQTIIQTVSATGIDPHFLELEITESVSMQAAEYTIATIRSLFDMGIQFSIDDFGTGFSSMSYLKRFCASKLKIDRSFVQDLPGDLEGAAIVEAIIHLGKILNLKVIAEGVETLEQYNFLRALNCDQCQGYYFGKPMPAKEFEKLLR